METLILGWYVLVETGSVLMLTVFASLQYIGTLLAPLFGVAGHRMGSKATLCAMRAAYTALAAVLAALALGGVLSPAHLFVIAALMGLVRPSDQVMRYALIGETMPSNQLMGAMSIQRTTHDSARIAGALTGVGLVAALGIGAALCAIVALYATSFCLTLGVAPGRTQARGGPEAAGAPSPWRDLVDGAIHVWTTPPLLAAMCVAFLVNLTAFPLVNGLLPYVARDVYGTGQLGLGYLAAGFAAGALAGSLTLSRMGENMRPARMMIAFCAVWYGLVLLFAHMPGPVSGVMTLMLAGFAQSLCIVPMSVLLLHASDARFRSRVMGIRMLAVYGVPLGLLVAGPLIAGIGYAATATIYCLVGLASTLVIAWKWRDHLLKQV